MKTLKMLIQKLLVHNNLDELMIKETTRPSDDNLEIR